ncbi:antitoxin [Ruania suaedae]|uniref:antitoxin n=1 Tax=Ruania suaedae TaxID=2897774 RepID=UPI001E5E5EA0|nr:antitoxin [Ruania suaedae]UFU02699.1 antitoxin [Ruania suaedae]
MPGFDELKRKAQHALGDEQKTDDALNRAARFVNDKTGGKHADKVEKGREFLDDKVGEEQGGRESSTLEDPPPAEQPGSGDHRR